MKKFKKKPKKITRNQKTILKRPLWLAPLLIGGFASGVYADGTDILGLSWGEKSQKVCVHHPWYALWSCDKWEEKHNNLQETNSSQKLGQGVMRLTTTTLKTTKTSQPI
ncbi:vacuolating cytotoxin VacA [Helicobacter pylori]|nr:vacuolating cytotoxin VacA [Helicobacter pylori]